ncbi:glutathione s-transferase parb [Colletotrichum sojae]|uniref:glutathione transferase n=1 Tax=Colletotrichum sojae TaxID=2175907 RepID=A0A8H6MSK4_9PEZI|nr:glutathione s-transferase parb [Colletotrichum sojae]
MKSGHWNSLAKAPPYFNSCDLSGLTPQSQTPELERLNPSGAVTFIQDHTYDPPLVLAERPSHCQVSFAAVRPRKANRKIAGPRRRGTPRAWAAFEEAASIEQTAFDVAANPLVFEEYFKPKYVGRSPDTERSQALRQRLSTALNVLETKLSKTKFMAGDKPTLVDLFYVPCAHYLKNDVFPSFLDGRPHLATWWETMESLSSYKAVFGSKSTRQNID